MLKVGQLTPQLKLLYHTDRIQQWLSGKTYPILVEIAPTGYCNATCPWCFFSKVRSSDAIDKYTLLTALKSMSDCGLKAINWSGGGEPTLHPDFDIFVKKANELGLKQGLFTNGFKEIPCQELFSWIRISLTDQGFKKIVKPKVPFGICVNHVVSDSIDQLKDWCLEAKEFGASYFQVRPALMGSHENQPHLSAPTFLKQYETNDFEVSITEYKYDEATQPRTYDKCYGYNLCPSIDWNGHLLTCLYMSGKKEYILGDLNTDSFLNIWNSLVTEKNISKECQNCCKNHEINKALYRIKYPELEHNGDFL